MRENSETGLGNHVPSANLDLRARCERRHLGPGARKERDILDNGSTGKKHIDPLGRRNLGNAVFSSLRDQATVVLLSDRVTSSDCSWSDFQLDSIV